MKECGRVGTSFSTGKQYLIAKPGFGWITDESKAMILVQVVTDEQLQEIREKFPSEI